MSTCECERSSTGEQCDSNKVRRREEKEDVDSCQSNISGRTDDVVREKVNDRGKSNRRPRRFVGRKKGGKGKTRRGRRRRVRSSHQIPDDLLQNDELNKAIGSLPSNYSFEIHKTIWKIRQAGARRVALQFPEGLLMYACTISDILEHFASVETLIMGDVTYGACCVDDMSARALDCDFLVHYGHSCLVPIDVTGGDAGMFGKSGKKMKVLYVFVEIGIDTKHLIQTLRHNFGEETRLAILGTIQFVDAIHRAAAVLKPVFASLVVPQEKPLSAGETLGCTSPVLPKDIDSFVFVADGRFHLESAMIHNPDVSAFLYNPYAKTLTSESYDTVKMKSLRRDAITRAQKATRWGVILGTLGRQGSPAILRHVKTMLRKRRCGYFVILMSEIFPAKLKLFGERVDAWVQIACPRLSIDWGHHFEKPLLSAYEFEVAMKGMSEFRERYPMDYYSRSGGSWSNYTAKQEEKEAHGGCS